MSSPADAPTELATPTVADVMSVMESAYPPETAQSWDAVGLIVGDPLAPVRRILLAVDPSPEVVREAIEWDADMLVTHHPLFLRGTTSVAADTAKGRVVHDLISHGCALFNAHTNADAAADGVADALASLFDLQECVPIEPLASSGPQAEIGIGRVGTLAQPTTFAEFARLAARLLPATASGLRAAGPGEAVVQRIAVSGGSGDSLLNSERVRGADVYLTADLRHHPAAESRESGGPFLIEATHWASEWPWLARAADVVRAGLRNNGGQQVEIHVSDLVTDAWNLRLDQHSTEEGERT